MKTCRNKGSVLEELAKVIEQNKVYDYLVQSDEYKKKIEENPYLYAAKSMGFMAEYFTKFTEEELNCVREMFFLTEKKIDLTDPTQQYMFLTRLAVNEAIVEDLQVGNVVYHSKKIYTEEMFDELRIKISEVLHGQKCVAMNIFQNEYYNGYPQKGESEREPYSLYDRFCEMNENNFKKNQNYLFLKQAFHVLENRDNQLLTFEYGDQLWYAEYDAIRQGYTVSNEVGTISVFIPYEDRDKSWLLFGIYFTEAFEKQELSRYSYPNLKLSPYNYGDQRYKFDEKVYINYLRQLLFVASHSFYKERVIYCIFASERDDYAKKIKEAKTEMTWKYANPKIFLNNLEEHGFCELGTYTDTFELEKLIKEKYDELSLDHLDDGSHTCLLLSTNEEIRQRCQNYYKEQRLEKERRNSEYWMREAGWIRD